TMVRSRRASQSGNLCGEADGVALRRTSIGLVSSRWRWSFPQAIASIANQARAALRLATLPQPFRQIVEDRLLVVDGGVLQRRRRDPITGQADFGRMRTLVHADARHEVVRQPLAEKTELAYVRQRPESERQQQKQERESALPSHEIQRHAAAARVPD